MLKSAAPELTQAVTQAILGRNVVPAPAATPVSSVASTVTALSPSYSSSEPKTPSVVALPTAYDQVAGQLRGLLERLQVQIKSGLDPVMTVETLLALESNNDPIAQLVLSAVEKSLTFESWLTWLRSQVGENVAIEQSTEVFLSKVFQAIKSLPADHQEEG
jgi:hypothetical protein